MNIIPRIVLTIIHSALLILMLVVTIRHCIQAAPIGAVISGSISVFCWLTLIIFFDIPAFIKYNKYRKEKL